MSTNGRMEVEMVSKPWGFEKIVVNTDEYCGKLLYVVKHKQTSLHYHKIKDETFFVHSGKIQLWCSKMTDKLKNIDPGVRMSSITQYTLKSGDSFRVLPGMVHSVLALEDTELYEFSTRHDDSDTVRL